MPLTFLTQLNLLNHLFANASMLTPTLYVGLSTTAPAQNGTGVTEPVGMGYARAAGPSWNPVSTTLYPSDTPKGASEHSSASASVITFPAATGTWTSGSTLYAVFYDASTGGNLVFYTQVNTLDGPVTSGKVVTIPAGGVTVRLTRASGIAWTPTVAKRALQHLLGLVTYTPPTWYLGLVTAVNVANETYTEYADASYSRFDVSSYWPNAATVGSLATLDFTGTTLTVGPVVGPTQAVFPVLFDASSSGSLAAYLGIHNVGSFSGIPLGAGDSMTFETGGLHMNMA